MSFVARPDGGAQAPDVPDRRSAQSPGQLPLSHTLSLSALSSHALASALLTETALSSQYPTHMGWQASQTEAGAASALTAAGQVPWFSISRFLGGPCWGMWPPGVEVDLLQPTARRQQQQEGRGRQPRAE